VTEKKSEVPDGIDHHPPGIIPQNQSVDQKALLAAGNSNPLPQTAEAAEAVQSHIRFLVNDLLQARPRIDSPYLRSVCRLVLRTYSDLHYNILTGPTPWDDTWMSRHPQSWRVGATRASEPANFMRNRYTWVSMRQEPADQLADPEAATIAVGTSTKPARTVLILGDNRSIRQYTNTPVKGVQKRILANISRDTRDLFIKDDTGRLARPEERDPFNPGMPMVLVIVQNSQAPSYYTSHLKELLESKTGITVHSGPEVRCHPPPDVEETPPTQVPPLRHHPLLRPSQTWYKATHWMGPPGPPDTDESKHENVGVTGAKKPDDRSIGDKTHRILALLGILPPGIGPTIATYWDTHEMDKSVLKNMSNLILNNTLALFKQDEAFRKWRRKTTAWRS
jgi:hypothetical protein